MKINTYKTLKTQQQKDNLIQKWAKDMNEHFFRKDIQISSCKDAQHL